MGSIEKDQKFLDLTFDWLNAQVSADSERIISAWAALIAHINAHTAAQVAASKPAEADCGMRCRKESDCRDSDQCSVSWPLPAAASGEAMPVTQEPKYGIRDNRLYNRASGEFIPADEPVFIFRARDRHAIYALAQYKGHGLKAKHAEAVGERIKDFRAFMHAFPARMKEPDTDAATTPAQAPALPATGEALTDEQIIQRFEGFLSVGADSFELKDGDCAYWVKRTELLAFIRGNSHIIAALKEKTA